MEDEYYVDISIVCKWAKTVRCGDRDGVRVIADEDKATATSVYFSQHKEL